ncbi:hypothetical protein AO263_32515, partial [Pseudomonas sp. NZIPFR-PS5]
MQAGLHAVVLDFDRGVEPDAADAHEQDEFDQEDQTDVFGQGVFEEVKGAGHVEDSSGCGVFFLQALGAPLIQVKEAHLLRCGRTPQSFKSICLGADCFAFGELLGKAPQVTKGACS